MPAAAGVHDDLSQIGQHTKCLPMTRWSSHSSVLRGGGSRPRCQQWPPSQLLCRRTCFPAHRMLWRVSRKWCREDMGSSGVVWFLPGAWPCLNSERMRGGRRRCVLKCRPAQGRMCCRHTRGFNGGRRGSLKLVACGEEVCSARPAASGALLAGTPV